MSWLRARKSELPKRNPYRFNVINAYRIEEGERSRYAHKDIRLIKGSEWAFSFDGNRRWREQHYQLAVSVLTSRIKQEQTKKDKPYKYMFTLQHDTENELISLERLEKDPKNTLGEALNHAKIDPNYPHRILRNPALLESQKMPGFTYPY